MRRDVSARAHCGYSAAGVFPRASHRGDLNSSGDEFSVAVAICTADNGEQPA